MNSIALQLPNSYVELEREEIEYVDGGFAVGVNFAGHAFNLIIAAICGGATASVSTFISSVGKKEAKKIFTRNIKSKLLEWGCERLAGKVAFAVDVALEFSDVGGTIARFLDAHDTYPNNGWIG